MSKVLIVEDDELIAELERDYLEAGGFDVELVFDGNEGMKRAVAGNWDALVLDVMLPGRNGFEVCREVRKNLDLPVLMVTAKKEDVDKIRGLGLGADDYLVKPFSPAELVARVKSHIQIHNRLLENCSRERDHKLAIKNLKILPIRNLNFYCFWRKILILYFQRIHCLTAFGEWILWGAGYRFKVK